jgi:hypothetical protein
MRRIGLGVGVVAVIASAGAVVLLLDRGGIWRGMGWPDTSTVLVLSLCAAAAVTGAVGGRLLTASTNSPTNRSWRAAITAVAGLGFLPPAVLAVIAGRHRDDPDVVAMSPGHYVGFAALGVVLGMIVVWTMLTVPATDGPVLAWCGWAATLVAVVVLDLPDGVLLLLILAVPAVLAGVLGFAVALPGRPVATATAVAMSGLLILAAVRWLVAAYWFGWAEQNAPCRVASGECQSTYLMYEVFLIPVLLMIPATVAAAGGWLGHRWSRRRSRPHPVPEWAASGRRRRVG